MKHLLVNVLDNIPAALRLFADAYTLPESREHLALQDAADALDDALDLLSQGDE